jgi:hypothetical protein
LISYGVYLWHWPLFVVLNPDRVHLTGGWLFLVRIAVTLAVAIASYFLIERPIRYGAGHPIAMLAAVPVIATILVIAIIGSTSAVPATERISLGPSQGGVMVVGDSVALSLVAGLQQVGIPATNRTAVGCSIVDGVVDVYNGIHAVSCGPLASYVAQQRPHYVVLVSGIYETVDVRATADGPVLRPGMPAFNRLYMQSLQAAIDALSSTGAKLVIPTVPCINPNEIPRDVRAQTAGNAARLGIENELLTRVVSNPRNRGRVAAPDLNGFLCPHGVFQRSLGTVRNMRPDGEHFSIEGARAVGRWLIRVVPGLKDAPHGATGQADALVGELDAAGHIYCAYAQPSRVPLSGQPTDTVNCKHANDHFSLNVFRDASSMARYIRVDVAVACKYRLQTGPSAVTYGRGTTWVVTGADAAVRLASKVLGVPVVTTRC